MGLMDSLKDVGPSTLPLVGAGAGYAIGGPAGAFLGGSLGTGIGNLWANQQNYGLQQQQFGYSKDLQKQIFAREDNAIQRRVMDLKAAGLSPVLAAGSGASAGAVVSTKAPQRDQMPDVAANMLALLKMREDVHNTVLQRDLIKAQTQAQQSQSIQALANAGRTQTEKYIADLDLQRYKVIGMNPRNASLPGKIASDVITGGATLMDQGVKGAKKAWNTYDAEMYKLQRKLEDYWKTLIK